MHLIHPLELPILWQPFMPHYLLDGFIFHAVFSAWSSQSFSNICFQSYFNFLHLFSCANISHPFTRWCSPWQPFPCFQIILLSSEVLKNLLMVSYTPDSRASDPLGRWIRWDWCEWCFLAESTSSKKKSIFLTVKDLKQSFFHYEGKSWGFFFFSFQFFSSGRWPKM